MSSNSQHDAVTARAVNMHPRYNGNFGSRDFLSRRDGRAIIRNLCHAIYDATGVNPAQTQTVQAWVLVRDFDFDIEIAALWQSAEFDCVSKYDVERCVNFVDNNLRRFIDSEQFEDAYTGPFDFPRMILASRIFLYFLFVSVDTTYRARALTHTRLIYQLCSHDLFCALASIVGYSLHELLEGILPDIETS